MQKSSFLISLTLIAFFPSHTFGAIGDSPSEASKTYGSTLDGQPNMLNVGGEHLHYQSAYLNTIVKIEAVYLKRKCVGIRYEAIPQIPDEKSPLTPIMANKFLDENFGQTHWRLANTKHGENGRLISQEYIHRRFFHTALYDGKSLTVWRKNGFLEAAQSPPE